MDKNNNIYVKTGFAISAFCVLMGAFASHFLKEIIDSSDLNTFDTGTKYMFYHALAISFIGLSHRKFHQNILDLSMFFFLAGIAFFTGSLYLLATRNIWGDDSYNWLGAITPVGGVLFISAWVILIVRGLVNDEEGGSTKKSKRKHRKSRSEKDLIENDTEADSSIN